jgi:hypothetical protein
VVVSVNGTEENGNGATMVETGRLGVGRGAQEVELLWEAKEPWKFWRGRLSISRY